MILRTSAVRWTAIAIAVLLASPWVTAAEGGTGTPAPAGTGHVKARVFASDGKTPIAGAIVRAHHLDTGAVYSSAPSAKNGECEISGLPYGYLDLTVETASGTFVGNQVVNVPPSGTAVVSCALTKYEERSPAWWSGKPPREIPGTHAVSQGVAEIQLRAVGREFWTGPKGIAIIGGTAAVVLLALSGGGGSSSASPSLP